MSGDDAFEALRLANPVPVLDPARLPEDVLVRILARSPRPRRRMRVAVAVGVVALASGAWTVFGPRDVPSKPLSVGCYAAADLDSRVEVVGRDGRPPEAICAELWRRGVFGTAPVPPLATCVLPSGTVGVFPGTGPDVCAAVQAPALRSPSGATPAGAPDPVALRQSLVEAFHAEGCVSVPRAVELVEKALAGGGFEGWTVEVAAATGPDRPCATLAFDVPRARVMVVPGPRVPSSGSRSTGTVSG